MSSLKGKVAMVTGSASKRAWACHRLAAAKEGADVIVAGQIRHA